MNVDLILRAPIVRWAALTVALGMLSGCLRPWAEAAPEVVVRSPAPPPVVRTLKDEVAAAPLAAAKPTGPRTVTVSENDTLFSIAWREDVALQSLVEANGLQSPYIVVPGQELAVPNLPEYVVQSNDTLYGISRCTGVDMAELARTNHLGAPYIISPGQRLRIPAPSKTSHCKDGKTIVLAPAPKASAPMRMAAVPRPATAPQVTKAVQTVAIPAKPRPVAKPPARGASRFLWPVDGKVVSSYGPKRDARQNNGINIAASPGAPVRAAENGVVVYAGNELRGYGNLLLVRHADGWTSAYAHNGELLVDRGAVVERGQVIAKVGTTGSVSSPQSHFELRKGAKAVDPVKFLSPR